MGITLTALHWAYLVFILLVIAFIVLKKDTSFICVAGIFVLGFIATSTITHSVTGIFNSFAYAIKELLGTILVISIIYGMSRVLITTGINEAMVHPFTRMIRTPSMAYWVIGILMMIISCFFWPSPAVALMGAVLLPVALKAKLPAMGVAVAMNLFGHGIALSGDFIIQGAPKLTADGAGIPVGDVITASVPLVIIMGIVTTIAAFWMLRRDLASGVLKVEEEAWEKDTVVQIKDGEDCMKKIPAATKKLLAAMVPVLFTLDILMMFILKLQGGDATALIGVSVHCNMTFIKMSHYILPDRGYYAPVAGRIKYIKRNLFFRNKKCDTCSLRVIILFCHIQYACAYHFRNIAKYSCKPG
jgi:TRAP-type C4-dicarboxylate transport system permease large subunit